MSTATMLDRFRELLHDREHNGLDANLSDFTVLACCDLPHSSDETVVMNNLDADNLER